MTAYRFECAACAVVLATMSPSRMQGAERFDHELDVEATRVYSVRYEQ